MGASGSGKTSLLNVISLRVPSSQVEGSLLMNSAPYDYTKFSSVAGYVM